VSLGQNSETTKDSLFTHGFFQIGPQLQNQFLTDSALQSTLGHLLPPDVLSTITPHLQEVGEDAAHKLFQWSIVAENQEPTLTHYEAWGKRVDEINMCVAWKNLEAYAATHGLVASGYERKHWEFSRVYQMALLYLFHPSSAFVSCPLAMTDGAAKLIEVYGDESLKKNAYRYLTSRDSQRFWTSGQWMTEKIGGSDVSLTETKARKNQDHFELFGTKYFTSATTSQMAMTLARIQGAEQGSRGLSLFYLETRLPTGQSNHIQINRLKDKLGTRAMPTAELELHGTKAQLVGGEGHGVKKIATLFNVTRIYNAVCSVAQMRRALALANDYAMKRFAFGKSVLEHALFKEKQADMVTEFEGCLKFIFQVAYLLGLDDTAKASEEQSALLRLLTPIVKLYTGKASVQVVSEMVEVFAGAGYCEDTGIPKLIRDAQVFPIWEGTTNVLSLDVIRALKKECPFEVLLQDMNSRIQKAPESPEKRQLIDLAQALSDFAKELVSSTDEEFASASAREFSMQTARTYIASLLIESATKEQTQRSRFILKRWLELTPTTFFHAHSARRNEARVIVQG